MDMPKGANRSMGARQIRELKHQRSTFFKHKLWKARLVLTDVTAAQLMAEEVIDKGNPSAPDISMLAFISQAAFEIDDYWRIVKILHKRLSQIDRKHWRKSYNVLILLDYLLTHGPKSIAVEFQGDTAAIQKMSKFQHVNEKGFNWGLTVQKKSQQVLKLLENGPLLKEEREQARRIKGLGSFDYGLSSTIMNDVAQQSSDPYWRSNSQYEEDHGGQHEKEDVFLPDQNGNTILHTSLHARTNKTAQTERVFVKENSSDRRPITGGEDARIAKLAIVSAKSHPRDGWKPSFDKDMLTIESQKENQLINFEEQIPLLLDYT